MHHFSLSRFAVARPLGFVPLLCAALLCLLAPARPASARDISTNETISTFIDDSVRVLASPTGSPTVNLVDGGTITGFLVADDTSTVNLSGGSIGGDLSVVGPNARLNVFGTNLSLSELMVDEFNRTFVVLSGTLADGTPAATARLPPDSRETV